MATKITTRVLADDAVTDAKIADVTLTTATQSASDNTTKIATTAYVTTAIANLADSAPSTLNTLNELAAALGDDASFSTTVTNSIATKLPLAGGALTGNLSLGSSTSGILKVGSANSFQIQKSGVSGYINQSDSGPIIVRMGSGFTERMRIDSSGNVGIGTSVVTDAGLWYDANPGYLAISHWATPPTPAAMLHLSDNSNDLDVPQIRIEGRENVGDTKLDISVKDAGVRLNLIEGPGGDASNGYGLMEFKTNAAVNNSNPTRGGFKFTTVADANNLVITNTGNVGIGTSSPAKLLTIAEAADGAKLRLNRGGVAEWDFSIGNSSTLSGVGAGALEILPQNGGTANEFAIGTAGNNVALFHLTNSQNYFKNKVGIGTTDTYNSEADNLIIFDSGNAGLTIATSSTSSNNTIHFADGTSGDAQYRGVIEYAHNDDSMRFKVNGEQEAMRIVSTEDVVIGYNAINTAVSSKTSGTGTLSINQPGRDNTGGHIFMTQGAAQNTWMTICTAHDVGATGMTFLMNATRTGDQNRHCTRLVRYAYNQSFTEITVSQQNTAVEYRVNGTNLQYRFTTGGPYSVTLTIMADG